MGRVDPNETSMSVTHGSCDLVYSLIIFMPDAQRYKLQSGAAGWAKQQGLFAERPSVMQHLYTVTKSSLFTMGNGSLHLTNEAINISHYGDANPMIPYKLDKLGRTLCLVRQITHTLMRPLNTSNELTRFYTPSTPVDAYKLF